MELTGACKEEFKKWLIKLNECICWVKKGEYETDIIPIEDVFQDLPDSMQWGVYQDYFLSVGVFADVNVMYVVEGEFYFESETNSYLSAYETINESRGEAITKANEIRNQQLKND